MSSPSLLRDSRRRWWRSTESVRHEAERDGVPQWLAWCVSLAPVVGGLALLLVYLVSRPVYYVLLQEDRPVEWLQFALCLFSGLLAGVAGWRFFRIKSFLLAALLVLVALGALVLAGEEISWAQRVFALGAPDQLGAVNAQGELNVHNIQANGLRVQDVFEWFSFLMGLGGAALALLLYRSRLRARLRWLQPLAPPIYTLTGFMGITLCRPLAQLVTISPVDRFQEWVEAGLFISIAMTVTCIYLRSWHRVELGVSTPTAPRPLEARTWRVPLVVLTGASMITVVFALLSLYHGIVPGNVVR